MIRGLVWGDLVTLCRIYYWVSQPLWMDKSLHAFALLSRGIGRVWSTLVQAHRKIWLAQSPLTEAFRRTLMGLQVVCGELFGSTVLAALEQSA